MAGAPLKSGHHTPTKKIRPTAISQRPRKDSSKEKIQQLSDSKPRFFSSAIFDCLSDPIVLYLNFDRTQSFPVESHTFARAGSLGIPQPISFRPFREKRSSPMSSLRKAPIPAVAARPVRRNGVPLGGFSFSRCRSQLFRKAFRRKSSLRSKPEIWKSQAHEKKTTIYINSRHPQLCLSFFPIRALEFRPFFNLNPRPSMPGFNPPLSSLQLKPYLHISEIYSTPQPHLLTHRNSANASTLAVSCKLTPNLCTASFYRGQGLTLVEGTGCHTAQICTQHTSK